MRSNIFPIIFLLVICLSIVSCDLLSPEKEQPQVNLPLTTITGEAQGTTYMVKYYDSLERDFKVQFDSILHVIDLSMSTYDTNSIISKFNKGDSCIQIDNAFLDVFLTSYEVFTKTDGAFDPSVMPLVRIWGFGPEDSIFLQDTAKLNETIKSKKDIVGFDFINLEGEILGTTKDSVKVEGNHVCKFIPEMELDFNAVAQGYSVDLLAYFLEQKGISSYLVELGGEIVAQGKKPDQSSWKIAIDDPTANRDSIKDYNGKAILEVNNQAVATSGSYRKFYMKDGKKYSHTIDPKTGKPVEHNLLSVSVIAADCASADAYATAFMVMGTQATVEFIDLYRKAQLEAYLIYEDEGEIKTYVTAGLLNKLKEN